MSSIALNYWPSSQLCMECKFGNFAMIEDAPSSTYACDESISLGPCVSTCESFSDKYESLEKEND